MQLEAHSEIQNILQLSTCNYFLYPFPEEEIVTLLPFMLGWCELTTRMAKFVRWLHSHTMRPVLLSILRILQPSALQFPLPATRET